MEFFNIKCSWHYINYLLDNRSRIKFYSCCLVDSIAIGSKPFGIRGEESSI